MKHIQAFVEFVTGVKRMRKSVVLFPVFLIAVVTLVLGVVTLQGCDGDAGAQGMQIPFADEEIFFEFNSTDLDLGIQIFFDGEGWVEVEVFGPDGRIFQVENDGSLMEIGSTEVFTESEEPELDEENLEQEIADFQDMFPEGEYEFRGTTIEGDELVGSAELTHDLPAAVTLDIDDFPTISWIDNSEAGDPVIVGYQAIVELVVEASDERVFEFSVDLLPSITEVTVPEAFVLQIDEFSEEEIDEFKVEVIAMEESGNKTITEESLLEEE